MNDPGSDFDNVLWGDDDNGFNEGDIQHSGGLAPAPLSPPAFQPASNALLDSPPAAGTATLAERRMSISEDSSPEPVTLPENNQITERPSTVEYPPISEGVLDCIVGSPLKENDGTKDAYISYLITTHVGSPLLSL